MGNGRKVPEAEEEEIEAMEAGEPEGEEKEITIEIRLSGSSLKLKHIIALEKAMDTGVAEIAEWLVEFGGVQREALDELPWFEWDGLKAKLRTAILRAGKVPKAKR
jgi:hypothetical protein